MHANCRQRRNLCATLSLLIALIVCGEPIGFAADPEAPSSSPPVPSSQPTEAGGDIQERGLTNARPGPSLGGEKILPPPTQPGGGPPPNLCHQVTQMLTQCKCFNQVDCQSLTTICPVACPTGSQSCQCIPTFRGTPPALPPNLCGYQVPLTLTQCSCSNDADCQVLATICPGACPVGSHSCQCTPLQRR
jgi:hypothetical protein